MGMIEVNNLSKYFGTKAAVQGISFTVAQGEILGFLGPNGAGKSTTMRMITGYIPPSGGQVRVGGHDVIQEPLAARRKMGYLPENAPVYPDMTVGDFLDFCARIRGFKGRARQAKLDETIERCFLKEVRNQSVNTLSKGYKQRVCFAQSIMHDPEVLIMDEPTDGLDPNQKYEVRQMISAMRPHKAIILSTHILDEMAALCTRAMIIAKGQIVADDTPDALSARSSVHGAVVVTLSSAKATEVTEHLNRIEGIRSTDILTDDGQRLVVRIYPKDTVLALDAVMEHLQQWQVQDIFVEKGRLDEVFRQLTTG